MMMLFPDRMSCTTYISSVYSHLWVKWENKIAPHVRNVPDMIFSFNLYCPANRISSMSCMTSVGLNVDRWDDRVRELNIDVAHKNTEMRQAVAQVQEFQSSRKPIKADNVNMNMNMNTKYAWRWREKAQMCFVTGWRPCPPWYHDWCALIVPCFSLMSLMSKMSSTYASGGVM